MASIYRRGRSWYASFKNADGLWMTKACGTDKTATQQIANRLATSSMLRREGLVDPTVDRIAGAEKQAPAVWLEAFRADILARNGNGSYASQVCQRAGRILVSGNVDRLSQLTASAVNTAIAALRTQNHHKASVSHHIRAVKMFSRWLYRNGHISSDPLVSVKVPTVAQSEKQIHRRALSKQEFETLVSSVESSGMIFGMTGIDRGMLYRIAGATGFRQGELRSLALESFDLESSAITVHAAYSKRRKDDRQPIPPALIPLLASWLESKTKGKPVFKMPVRWEVAEMLRRDMGDAGLDCTDIDFHCLRVSYISWLVQSGANVKTCQQLARHSTPVLTIGTYARVSLNDEANALASLPGTTPDERQSLRATGTDGRAEMPAENMQKTGFIFGHKASLAVTSETQDMPVGVCEENPHQMRESIDSIDCPGRDSNPHDRKRSQDFKS